VGDISLSIEAGDHTIKTVEICVLIASYRDPDCAPTLADLFAQAAHPERIRVAVVSQEEKGDRLKTSLIPKAYHAQIGIRRVKSTSSQGVCWARHLGQQMVGQEPFILQLDSHMRFEPGLGSTVAGNVDSLPGFACGSDGLPCRSHAWWHARIGRVLWNGCQAV